MQKRIGNAGTIIVWSKKFECSRNKELAERIPDFKNFFDSVNNRTYDLMDIFTKQHFVHKDFHGSASLKSVLPVLVPSLSYDALEIREGGSASLAYEKWMMGEMTEEEWQKTHQALLDYCKLDTLAMVEILGVLNAIC